jgi:hypothetical protein
MGTVGLTWTAGVVIIGMCARVCACVCAYVRVCMRMQVIGAYSRPAYCSAVFTPAVPLAYLFSFTLGYGLPGLWYGWMIGNASFALSTSSHALCDCS